MTRSRRTQRALERDLFGPGPKALRRKKQVPTHTTPIEPSYDDCPFCVAVILSPSDPSWTCGSCGHVYPAGSEPNTVIVTRTGKRHIIQVRPDGRPLLDREGIIALTDRLLAQDD